MQEEKKVTLTPEELKETKESFSNIRICQINLQQAELAYHLLGLKLAKKYNIQDELYDIDRLTGVVKIKPGLLPGVGGGSQQR